MISVEASRLHEQFDQLKTSLRGILDTFDRNSRIFYIDYPVHSNIGDLLINLGTEQFFLDHNIPIYKRYSVLDLPKGGIPDVDGNTTFLCHGGGNFGDIYEKHQGAREWLIETYPQSRIIIMPQSLHYGSDAAKKKSFEKLARHPQCHIFVRDKNSFNDLKQGGLKEVSMMPDMAHELWNVLQPVPAQQSAEPMYFFRRDPEATSLPPELASRAGQPSVDWIDIVRPFSKAHGGAAYYLLSYLARMTPETFNTSLWYGARDRMVDDSVRFFSQYKLIYTNRLHAMLLALLLQRDVRAFDNSYGKLTRYIDAWLSPQQS